MDNIKYEELTELKFAKLYSPKMKSVYWRHFGFPSNENNDVITKQNVVCMLCHKVLTNHGNTTNLRAHLQHRHKDIFEQICRDNAINVPPRKKYTNQNTVPRNVSRRRVKMEYISSNSRSESENEHTTEVTETAIVPDHDDTELYEHMVPLTYEEGEEPIEDNYEALAYTKIEETSYDHEMENSSPTTSVLKTKRRRFNKNETVYQAVPIIDKKETLFVQTLPIYQINVALMNIVVEDLRNIDTLFESGMSAFVRLVAGDSVMPTPEQIEEVIREQHINKFEVHYEFIKRVSHEKLYSLGFDLWSNIEQKQFLTIYFNYLGDAPHYRLNNEIYTTVEYNEFTSISDVLVNFDLQNCTAAIVNYEEDDQLKAYFTEQNIYIVLSFDYIVEKCLRQVFELPEVVSVVNQMKDCVNRLAAEINTKEVELPTRHDNFCWSYYEWLKFFSEFLSWTEDLDNVVNNAKIIIDSISALVVTIETLRGEDIPLISMLSPVTSKILNKKLCISEQDESLLMNIKRTISNVLHLHVISDETLTIAAFLDPRFHRLTEIDDFDGLVQTIKKKYEDVTGNSAGTPNTPVTQIKDSNIVKRSPSSGCSNVDAKKSRLELFFDLDDTPVPPLKGIESSLETDLKRYRNEVIVSLDESPQIWWEKMGHIYSTLQQLAPFYQCIPGVVNSNFKKPVKQQVSEFMKRSQLTGDLIDAILYLNQHKS